MYILPNPSLHGQIIIHPDKDYYSNPYFNVIIKGKYPDISLEYSYTNDSYNLMCNLEPINIKLNISISKTEHQLIIRGGYCFIKGDIVILKNSYRGIHMYLFNKNLKRKIKYHIFCNYTETESNTIEIEIPEKKKLNNIISLIELVITILSKIIIVEHERKSFSQLFINTMGKYMGNNETDTIINSFFGNFRERYIPAGDYNNI